MSDCPRCGGCETKGVQPCPACAPPRPPQTHDEVVADAYDGLTEGMTDAEQAGYLYDTLPYPEYLEYAPDPDGEHEETT
jgi:hypothetical protein